MTDITTTAAAAPITEGVAASETSVAAPTLLDGPAQSSSTAAPEGEGVSAGVDANTEEKQPDDQPKGAPDEYEEFTLPEGHTIDPEVNATLKALAKELNLDQGQAQKVAELGAQMSARWTSQLQAHIDATSDAWEAAAKADKDIGGDKLAANLGLAKSALDQFGTPELRELLNASRLGNHPDMIRLLAKVGQATSDDNRITTGKPPAAPGTRSAASVLFPSQQG